MVVLSPKFVIGHIRIGTVEGASCVNVGNNSPSHFQNHKKHNQGFGSVTGDRNQLDGLNSLLSDAAFMDFLAQCQDENVPDWVKDLIQNKAT
ncbi:hypothetical protein N781_00725 [Pontibacillus halophilus JSM 076056 = DSM 19796]|uniref:Uncharacterized protein n=1 Tax=Pontibacillus halophilus JSM 076056 = DSM 19796 TaxID=1385510 RepID=A0A0A5GKF0_9BACI|nr:hypothetical protein [Pontibacillus halophilus]KGX93761.1 hypothetical protein N781_00725 [Pontibacillus halophilus JSM 076056 = DSM 19796]